MVLPQTPFAALMVAILCMVCWGSWANTYKLVGKWRFELFYGDFALGAVVAAAVAALTVGTLGFDGFLFTDDLMRASRHSIAYGLAAGGIFNLANMLLLAAMVVTGMSVAFPIVFGLALIVGVAWSQVVSPRGNPTLLYAGLAVVLAAIVVDVLGYRRLAYAKVRETIKTGKAKSTRVKVGWKGIVLSVVGGLLMGSFSPLVEVARAGDAGLGPYAMGFVFITGVFFTTFVYDLFFMNLPVQGGPVEILEFFRGTLKQHALGVLGGMVWGVGMISNLVVTAAPEARLAPSIGFGVVQGATVVCALWGLLAWKEFREADSQARILMGVMVILLAGGLAVISIAALQM